MQRRDFLLGLAAGTLAALSACDAALPAGSSAPGRNSTARSSPAGNTTSSAPASPTAPPVGVAPGPDDPGAGPPPAVITTLPGTGSKIALTVDDGTDSAVVGAYLDFVEASGVRLTFFPNGDMPSWTEHAATLQPLIESGQVQMGNHTWSHPDLRKLSDAGIAQQLNQNEVFLNKTYGVTARPFVRPPFGFHDPRVDAAAAEVGYSTMVLWYGSLGDSAVLTPQVLMQQAQRWLQPQHVVIGHANHPAVTQCYDAILELLRERSLQTVTLDDVWYGGKGRDKTPNH